MTDIVTTQPSSKILEQLLIAGDLSALSAAERLDYYARVCESLGLNPLTKPFAYIKLNGKLVLYGLKNCAEQLRKIHGVSVHNLRTQMMDDEMYVVAADFIDGAGRTDQATGVVCLKGLIGENRANKMLTCETKCKNRGTYSIVGLGMLDETEVDSIAGAEKIAAEKFKPLTAMAPIAMEQQDGEEQLPLASPPAATINAGRHRALEKAIDELEDAWGRPRDFFREELKRRMAENLGCEHFHLLTVDQYEQVMGWVNEGFRRKLKA